MDRTDLSFKRARCERVNAVLRRYHGGHAELLQYIVSHQKLTIRVTVEGLEKNCQLFCGACRYISSPSGWESASLELQLDESRGEYVLVDADVHIRFHHVSVMENAEPVFFL